MRAEAIVGLLAEPQRMQVFAAVVLGAGTAEQVREATGLDRRAVATALRKLQAGGLVEESEGDDKGYRPVTAVFREAARSAAPPVEQHGYADERVEAVVRTFVRDGRITGMPAQLGRRRVLLEHVVQSFEPGRDYTEKEVNVVLQAWAADGPVDHVSLRRYLVDDGLLSRGGAGSGRYRRSGGWLDVLGDPPADQPQESLGTQGN